jgi:hypothetical protein
VLGLKKILSSLIFTSFVYAHVPNVSQIVRFQPQQLRASHAFVSKGSLTLQGGKKLVYTLQWFGPMNYQVESDSWTLRRHEKQCTLSTTRQSVSCAEVFSPWMLLELSAQPDIVAKKLASLKMIDDEDVPFKETNTLANESGGVAKNLRLGLGQNGSTPKAVVEILGQGFSTDPEPYPLMQFDQTFLCPLLMRFPLMNTGTNELVTIKATTDTKARKEHPRFSAVLSQRVEVLSGKRSLGTLTRDEPATQTLTASKLVPAPGELSALSDNLSSDGALLLTVLLALH